MTFDDATGLPTEFLIDRRQADLERADRESAKLNPRHTADEAVDLRQQSQRLEGWTIALVLAVVLLTIATITRNARVRPMIASAAFVIYAVSASFALFGG